MMEFSSPLAAMHPPSMPAWGARRDLPTSRFMFPSSNLASNTFDFRDLSMQKAESRDYFSMKPPTRGSSPTASLAADLSCNFHIDQSPQIPTPRRSLFARDMLLPYENKELLVTPPIDYEGATTPPIPSSSPGNMDISPLPHKAPCFVAHVTLPSPSPEQTPEEEDEEMLTPGPAPAVLAPPSTMMDMSVAAPMQQERKRPTLQRPSLLRSKMYSTTSVPGPYSALEPLLPPFQFGSSANASTPTLRSFAEPLSATEESPSVSLFQPSNPPRRPSLGLTNRANGSPVGGFARKASFVPPRPRKQVRRSLSMFQHPDDVMKGSEEYEPPVSNLQPVMDVDTEYKPKLPHFVPDEPDSLPRIQKDTLINVINGQYNSHYDKVLIVDCRFEYEYEGGHIESAVNYNDKERLAKDLFDEIPPPRTLLIFHCEYSVHRAPRMAKFVRQHDRQVNAVNYPQLTYPEMYILEGGYHQFFKQHREKCFPQNYIEMEHKDHEQACEKGMGKLKQRAKLSRAQTFAFGQSSPQLEDSPTSNIVGSRMGARSFSTLEMNDVSPMMARHFTRRLVTA